MGKRLSAVRIILVMGLVNGLAVCAQDSTRGVQAVDSSGSSLGHTRTYHALIIGNQNYVKLPKLRTPAKDAKEIAAVLHERYGFQTNVLIDAGRDQIITALSEYRRTLSEESSLLIYYAGHGHHDRDADEAYWLPIDALPDNTSNWISADDITRNVKAMRSAHVLVISDSCFSGFLADSRSAHVGINPAQRYALIEKMLSSKSRNLMASGRDEPVADNGAPGHSVFASAVLDGLRKMDDAKFTASDLFERFIQPKVGGQSSQLPQYSVITNSGHEYGDFVFSRPTANNQMAALPQGQARSAGRSRSASHEPQVLSQAQAEAMVVSHGYFHRDWNAGGGENVHKYENRIHGDDLMVFDSATGLLWQRGGSNEAQTYDKAIAYVKALNAKKYGGFDDWRLPTLDEAMSLMTSPDHGQPGEILLGDDRKSVVYHMDKSFKMSGAYYIWTADLEPSNRAWIVYFQEGYCQPEKLEYNAYVRAVRSVR